MASERTYVFTPDGGSSGNGGSKFDIMALLPNLMGGRSVDPGLLALLNQGRNNQDAWGGSWWFIWIVLLWFCWGGNGFGGFGNRNGAGGLPAELNGDVGREYLMSAIQGNGTAISQLASSLNCSTQQLQTALSNVQSMVQGVGSQVGMSAQQIINAFQSGNQAVLTQIANSCCNTQQAIERTSSAQQLQSCQNMNTLTREMCDNTRSLRDGNAANTQSIIAKLDAMQSQTLQDRIATLQAQNATLQGEISQRNQNSTILTNVSQQIAPIVATLQALQSDVDGIKCKLPNTVSIPYPQLKAYNPEVAQAAAYGAYAGDVAYNRGAVAGTSYWL